MRAQHGGEATKTLLHPIFGLLVGLIFMIYDKRTNYLYYYHMSSAYSLIRVPHVLGRDQEDLKVDERNRGRNEL